MSEPLTFYQETPAHSMHRRHILRNGADKHRHAKENMMQFFTAGSQILNSADAKGEVLANVAETRNFEYPGKIHMLIFKHIICTHQICTALERKVESSLANFCFPASEKSRTILQWRIGPVPFGPDIPPPSCAEIWHPRSEQPLDSLKHTMAWPPFSLIPCQTHYMCRSGKGLEELRFPFGFCGRFV
ncbi:hypothetical protein MJG53_004274 [Ovis ammon polii x Ovis aries]|uniref:Uncharacterized protein n=1 Tax=Ovis ammon polii x Ovis aries TaxID=2918886 RepID=A0ACB9V9B7_9CETA|nr:hypothetical protein MJG53_004274 [Ovis ammon polii x Ovis aries]